MALPSHIAAWLSLEARRLRPAQPPKCAGLFLHPASPRSAGAENSNRLDFYPINALTSKPRLPRAGLWAAPGAASTVPPVFSRRPDRRRGQPWAICGPARGIYSGDPSASVAQLPATLAAVGRVAPGRNEQPTATCAERAPACPPLAPPRPQPERARARRFVHFRRHDATCALRLGEKYALRALRLPETSTADRHPSKRGKERLGFRLSTSPRGGEGGSEAVLVGQRRCFRLFRTAWPANLQPLERD
jgi:hypothetical protein